MVSRSCFFPTFMVTCSCFSPTFMVTCCCFFLTFMATCSCFFPTFMVTCSCLFTTFMVTCSCLFTTFMVTCSCFFFICHLSKLEPYIQVTLHDKILMPDSHRYPWNIYLKVIKQGKCSRLFYCSALSLGVNVNHRRMSELDMRSIFHVKKNQWNILVKENYYVNYQNLMLLSSTDTKQTLMHLLLFTNSAQRELVSIYTQSIRNCNLLTLHYNLALYY